jgi:Cu-processing system ATP-binding protein
MNERFLIDLRGVSKRYTDKLVVNDVTLQAGAGECVVLVGHNGAGKTTLMKLMLGLTHASAGQLRVLGENPYHRSSATRRGALGYLPETVAFHESMTGQQALAFYARLKGEPVSACAAALEQVGLHDAARQRIQTYSKGMRQRLGLAQAILGRPQILLLDEPTTGLDPSLRRYFYNIIDMLRTEGTTTLISSHALDEVEARVNRVAIMKRGRLAACGSLAELGRQAALPVRIRITAAGDAAKQVGERLGSGLHVSRIDSQTLGVACQGSEKMDVLRRLAGLGSLVADVDITPPRLEEIYTYFTEGGAPQ